MGARRLLTRQHGNGIQLQVRVVVAADIDLHLLDRAGGERVRRRVLFAHRVAAEPPHAEPVAAFIAFGQELPGTRQHHFELMKRVDSAVLLHVISLGDAVSIQVGLMNRLGPMKPGEIWENDFTSWIPEFDKQLSRKIARRMDSHAGALS